MNESLELQFIVNHAKRLGRDSDRRINHRPPHSPITTTKPRGWLWRTSADKLEAQTPEIG